MVAGTRDTWDCVLFERYRMENKLGTAANKVHVLWCVSGRCVVALPALLAGCLVHASLTLTHASPSKNETLTQRWFTVGLQRWPNSIPTLSSHSCIPYDPITVSSPPRRVGLVSPGGTYYGTHAIWHIRVS